MKPKPITAELRRWRTARHLTQAQAAAKLGVTHRTLENWEQGTSAPRGLALAAIRKRLAR